MTITYCDKCGANTSGHKCSIGIYVNNNNEAWFHLCKLCADNIVKQLNMVRKKNHG